MNKTALDYLEERRYKQKAFTYSIPRRLMQRAKVLFAPTVKSGGLGLDGSAWQMLIDALAAKAAGILYGLFRARYGVSLDTKFSQHWTAFSGVLPRSAYLYYLDNQDAFTQADKLFESIPAADREEITVVIDIEGYNNPTLTISKIKQCCERLNYLFGRKPIIYTGYYIWNGITGDKAWAASYPLWIAAYPFTGWADDYPTKVLNYPPLIPYPWEMWLDNPDAPLYGYACIWQFTSSAPASKFGASGTFLDLNHCSPAFAKKYALGETLPPPPDPVPVGEPNMQFINTGGDISNIRAAPVVNTTNIIGKLPDGAKFIALEIDFTSGYAWAKYAVDPVWLLPGKTGATGWSALVATSGNPLIDFYSAVPCPEGEPIPMTPEQLQRLEAVEATAAQHELEITVLQNTAQPAMTHKIVTTEPNGVKLDAYPAGGEAVMLLNDTPVRLLKTKLWKNQKLYAARVGDVWVSGWLAENEVIPL